MKSLVLILLLCASGWSACDKGDDVTETHYSPIPQLIKDLPVSALDEEDRAHFTRFFQCTEAQYHQGFIDAISWIVPPGTTMKPLQYYKLLIMAAYHRTPETARFAFLNANTLSKSTGNLANDIEEALDLEVVGDTVRCKKSSKILHRSDDPLVLLPWAISEQYAGIPWTVSEVTGSGSGSASESSISG